MAAYSTFNSTFTCGNLLAQKRACCVKNARKAAKFAALFAL